MKRWKTTPLVTEGDHRGKGGGEQIGTKSTRKVGRTLIEVDWYPEGDDRTTVEGSGNSTIFVSFDPVGKGQAYMMLASDGMVGPTTSRTLEEARKKGLDLALDCADELAVVGGYTFPDKLADFLARQLTDLVKLDPDFVNGLLSHAVEALPGTCPKIRRDPITIPGKGDGLPTETVGLDAFGLLTHLVLAAGGSASSFGAKVAGPDDPTLLEFFGATYRLSDPVSGEPLTVEPAPEPVDMIAVESSNLAAIGYDASGGELLVDFKRGGRYAYAGVDRKLFDAFLASDSKGRFFATQIRNVFKFEKRGPS